MFSELESCMDSGGTKHNWMGDDCANDLSRFEEKWMVTPSSPSVHTSVAAMWATESHLLISININDIFQIDTCTVLG